MISSRRAVIGNWQQFWGQEGGGVRTGGPRTGRAICDADDDSAGGKTDKVAVIRLLEASHSAAGLDHVGEGGVSGFRSIRRMPSGCFWCI